MPRQGWGLPIELGKKRHALGSEISLSLNNFMLKIRKVPASVHESLAYSKSTSAGMGGLPFVTQATDEKVSAFFLGNAPGQSIMARLRSKVLHAWVERLDARSNIIDSIRCQHAFQKCLRSADRHFCRNAQK